MNTIETKPASSQPTRQAVSLLLANVSGQLLDIAREFDGRGQMLLPQGVGQLGEELDDIVQHLDYEISVSRSSSPEERLAGLVPALNAAASALEPESDGISDRIRQIAAALVQR